MSLVALAGQELHHCLKCGVTFLDEQGLDKLSLEDAYRLMQDRREDFVSEKSKSCPRDLTPLSLTADESSLSHVSILKCATCHGVMVYPNDLVILKTAQDAKLTRHKGWEEPVRSLKHVLVLTFLGFLVVGIAAGSYQLARPTLFRPQATELIRNIESFKSGNFVLVAFTTAVPAQSKIIFTESLSGRVIEKVVSTTLQTSHQLTTGELDLTQDIYFQVVIYDGQATEIGRSDEIKLNPTPQK